MVDVLTAGFRRNLETHYFSFYISSVDLILNLAFYLLIFPHHVNGTEWSLMCWCAVKKLLTHSLTHSLAATVTVTLFSCYLSFHVIWCSNQGQTLLKIIDNGSIRKPGYGFLFAFHSNHGSILYRFRDKGRYWPLPLLHSTPPLGGTRSKYCYTIWYRKTGFGYSMVKTVWWYV